MSKVIIPAQFGVGGAHLTDGTLKNAITELQGLTMSVFAGAAAGTAMAVAALRLEDTLIGALITTDAGGAAANDVGNMTIQDTRAFGTLTISGNPVEGETFVVGDSTYTFKAVPSALTDVKITAGNNTAMATAAAAAINANEARLTASGYRTPTVSATSVAGVVTISSVVDGLGNGVVLTGTAVVLAATGTGTASATLTPVTVVADNTCVINGVTFTAKAAPVGMQQFYTKAAVPAQVGGGGAGTDLATGQYLAKVINAYEDQYGTLDVVASAHAVTGVVTLVPRKPKAGNIIPLTEAATNVAVTGAGTLTSGTNTGGVKSTTNLTGKTVTLLWFNKR